MILRDVGLLALAGLSLGVPAALVIARLLRSMFYGIAPNDPWTIAMSAAVLLAAAGLAGYIPARKATRVNPIVALRHE
jgi:ABC-type antimicrobial peptide transport system permease subunit